MSTRRALVDCVVLSLQDSPVFYPCCKGCFSRINVKQRDRCRCFQCGYSCTADLVGYRYRLSLKVARDDCIFALTVFGTCLNPFFGIDASGLQRLVINLDDPVGTATRSTLLLKAVQDCFIGRHFIFGIKLSEADPQPWIRRTVQNESGNNRKAQVVASQMLHPKALGLEGCTVISYYQSLLQKVVESELGGADLNRNLRLPLPSLLVNPHHSFQSSFGDGALWSSSRLSYSALSSQNSNSSFSCTPPWQQSLGLVTSSAEQEEDGCNRDSGDEDNSNAERFKSLDPKKRDCPKDHGDSEETAVSPLKKEVTLLSQWTLPDAWSAGHTSLAKWLSPTDVTEPSMWSSVAWEDLPFSESLAEYLCEKQDCDVTEPERTAHNQRETPRVRPQDQILSSHSSPASPSDILRVLMDVTNTSSEEQGCGFSKRVSMNHVTSANNSHAKSTCCDACNHEEEEHFDADLYDCSADLFSQSVTDTPNRTVRSVAKTRLLTSDQRRSGEKSIVSGATPSKRKQTQKRNNNRDSLLPPDTPQLDFVPPSQSTPIGRAGSSASHRCSTSVGLCSLPDIRECSDFESQTSAKIRSSPCKINPLVRPRHHCEPSKTRSNSCGDKFALKRRFGKPAVTRSCRLPLQALEVQRAAANMAPTEKVNGRWDTSSGDVIACESMNDMLVPPTPLARTQPSGNHRKPGQADNGSPNLDRVWEGDQEDGVDYGRTARNQTLTPLCAGPQTRNRDSKAVVGGLLGASPSFLLDESKACDWSRDLFSDSA